MRNFYKLTLFLLTLITLSSCVGVSSEEALYKITPYDRDYYMFNDAVSSVVESVYDRKYSNGNFNLRYVTSKTTYNFSVDGRLTSKICEEGNSTIKYIMVYNDDLDLIQIDFVDSDKSVAPLKRSVKKEGNGTTCVNFLKDGAGLSTRYYASDEGGYWVDTYNVLEDGRYSSIQMLSVDELGNVSKIRTSSFGGNEEQYKDQIFENGSNKCAYGAILELTDGGAALTERGRTAYSYIEDDNGNWTSQLEVKSGSNLRMIRRKITYFDQEQVAAAIADGQLDENGDAKSKGIGSVKVARNSVTPGDIPDSFLGRVIFKVTHFTTFGGPSVSLLVILVILTVLLSIWVSRKYKYQISDIIGSSSGSGMSRMWMYNRAPYMRVVVIVVVALIGFLLALVSLFLFGGGTLLLFWIINILLTILIWVGVICTILGALLLWAGSPYSLLLGIPGILIWVNDDKIERAGNSLVNSGFEFMNRLNMFEWGFNIFVDHWDVLITVFLFPLLLFMSFALLVIALNGLLNGTEMLIMRIYNVSRPCPSCGSKHGCEYIVNGQVHPKALRPGMYGVFYQTSPVNGEKLPTMLLNGKGKLDRRCVDCHTDISSKSTGNSNMNFGTDIHIGVVGHRSSGKSYMLYSALSLLMGKRGDRLTQIDADNDTSISQKKGRIDLGGDIQTDEKALYKAVQLMLKEKTRPIPYHLFFYDVAGEKFNSSSKSHLSAMDFYKNVDSIIFVLDPMMVDFTGMARVDDDLLNWIAEKDKKFGYEKNNIRNTFTILMEILNRADRVSKKINFSFVCVKKDLGYFESVGLNADSVTTADVEDFICKKMALSNIVNSARKEFKSVSFYAVSAVSKNQSALEDMFVDVLKHQGVRL